MLRVHFKYILSSSSLLDVSFANTVSQFLVSVIILLKMRDCLFVILTFIVLAMNAHVPALLLKRDCFYSHQMDLAPFSQIVRYICVGLA